MTLDVAIGKIVVDQDSETGRAYLGIEPCPNATFDVCERKYTLWMREAYRSGSTGFWLFWKENDRLYSIYNKMRDNPDSNDRDVTFLAKYVDDIMELDRTSFSEPAHRDRLKWLQYWVKKAVELYGEQAGIRFS